MYSDEYTLRYIHNLANYGNNVSSIHNKVNKM